MMERIQRDSEGGGLQPHVKQLKMKAKKARKKRREMQMLRRGTGIVGRNMSENRNHRG
jgi:hypothetical protein